MRKSEVIEQIGKIFGNRGSGDYNTGEYVAPFILEYLESIGMLPPAHTINTLNNIHYFPERKVYTWEPEHEEK